MFILVAMAVMLIGATAFATEDAFADKKKKYGMSQATAQANYCGNGDFSSHHPNGISTATNNEVEAANVWCQNTASQIHGNYNSAELACAR
jgi:hypothetical protein